MSVRSFQRAHARRHAREQRRLSTLRRKSSLVAGLALSSSALFAANAQAADYTVTTNGDGPAAACTGTPATTCADLRDAINAANTDGTADTITFAPSVTGTIDLAANGALSITTVSGLTITGPGAGNLAVSGGGSTQDIYIHHSGSGVAAVSITGLTITDGESTSPGGAVENINSALTLTNDVISGSTTTSNRGGGGIYSERTNASTGAPTGLTLSGTTVSGNTASSGAGGGIKVSSGYAKYTGDTIDNSSISGNTSSQPGGGIETSGDSMLAISGTQITGNKATGSSGGGVAAEGGTLKLTSSTVSGNTTPNAGGGVYVATKYGATFTGTKISGNAAYGGGGLYVTSSYAGRYNPIRVQDSTVSGNQARYGAGVETGRLSGPMTIVGSTLSGNSGGTASFGGGLLIDGNVYSKFELSDSTVSGNTAAIGAGVSLGYGQAQPLDGPNANGTTGSIGFDNSTIAANTASAHAGGIYLGQYQTSSSSPYQSGVVGLTSTIVGGNTAAGIADDLERGSQSTTGGFDGAFSLVQAPGSAPLTKNAVITGVSPQLGPLANNGGATQTMLPSGTSPVIDQGHSPASLTTDQRGLPRLVDTAITNPPGGDGTDIGAVELPASGVVLPPVPPTPPPTPTPTSGITLSIHGASLSVSNRSLLVGNQTPVTCSVKSGTLNSCVVEVRLGSILLGSGEVTSTKGVTSLSTQVTPTKAGVSYLKHRQFGVDSVATLVASQSAAGSPTVTGNVHFLAGPSITLGLGKRSAKLSKNVVSELGRVAKLLTGAKSFTCTAYSDAGKHDIKLTKSQAGAACAKLKKDGLTGKSRIVARGHAKPIATNRTSKGRAANRRLVISFTF